MDAERAQIQNNDKDGDSEEMIEGECFLIGSYADEEIREEEDGLEFSNNFYDAVDFLHAHHSGPNDDDGNVKLQTSVAAKNQSEDHGLLYSATSMNSRRDSGVASLLPELIDLNSQTLEELVVRLLRPKDVTVESNDICCTILLHPDLLNGSPALNVYSKMNGGLKNYSPGTADVWLYTPRKRSSSSVYSSVPSLSGGVALVFVYPDESGGPSKVKDEPKDKLHFGGRAQVVHNESVVLQHGGYKSLGLKARKFQLLNDKMLPGATSNDGQLLAAGDSEVSRSASIEEAPLSSSFDELQLDVPAALLAQPPISPRRYRDRASFDAEVEGVRERLKGSDLLSIKAILSEVWAREVASEGELPLQQNRAAAGPIDENDGVSSGQDQDPEAVSQQGETHEACESESI